VDTCLNDIKIYEGAINLSTKNNSHTIMFDFIWESSHKKKGFILEVGCASGYFGKIFKDRGYKVWGVEISPQQASVATGRLDNVFTGSIEEFIESDHADGIFFDYILFGDVLEHLRAPLSVLRSCSEILSPGGAVLASIPNVAHLSVRLMLLEGRWEYAPFGILDDTHLKFFTRRSIVELFSKAGYSIESMYAVRVPVEEAGIEVSQDLLEKAKDLIVDNDQDVYQYVLMARKRYETFAIENNRQFLSTSASHILCLLPIENWSVGDIRLRNPLERWRQIFGGVVRIKNIHAHTAEDLSWADYVILQREANVFTIRLIDKLQELGKPIIFDIDDLLTEVPPFLSSHRHAVENKIKLEKALRMADAVTVTTDRLKKKMKTYNDNVFIVPNCASSNNVRAEHYKTEDKIVNLIVASSDTVRVDFVVQALVRLQADADLNIRIIGVGPPGKYILDTGLDVKCYDNMDYDSFTKFLSSIDNAIGIIPLDASEFSACKSAIKYVDYSLAGIPVVCSSVSPYKDVIKDGVTGLLVDYDEKAWFTTIRRLALSVEDRQRISTSAMKYCLSEFSMASAAKTWDRVFSTVPSGQGKRVDKSELKAWIKWQRVGFLLRHCIRPSSYIILFRLILKKTISSIKQIVSLVDKTFRG